MFEGWDDLVTKPSPRFGLVWSKGGILNISYDPKLRSFKQAKSVDGTQVRYQMNMVG